MDKPAIIVTLTALEVRNAVFREQESIRAKICKMAQSGTNKSDMAIQAAIKKVLELEGAYEKIDPESKATYAIIQVTPIGGEDGE